MTRDGVRSGDLAFEIVLLTKQENTEGGANISMQHLEINLNPHARARAPGGYTHTCSLLL